MHTMRIQNQTLVGDRETEPGQHSHARDSNAFLQGSGLVGAVKELDWLSVDDLANYLQPFINNNCRLLFQDETGRQYETTRARPLIAQNKDDFVRVILSEALPDYPIRICVDERYFINEFGAIINPCLTNWESDKSLQFPAYKAARAIDRHLARFNKEYKATGRASLNPSLVYLYGVDLEFANGKTRIRMHVVPEFPKAWDNDERFQALQDLREFLSERK